MTKKPNYTMAEVLKGDVPQAVMNKFAKTLIPAVESMKLVMEGYRLMEKEAKELLNFLDGGNKDLSQVTDYVTQHPPSAGAIAILAIMANEYGAEEQKKIFKDMKSKIARKNALTRHSKPGGAHDKQEKIRAIWATGKYSSRNACAEQECAGQGMSYETARKALINTPKPT